MLVPNRPVVSHGCAPVCCIHDEQVEAFTNKTGKFAIKGYPNKLGFLLHGPPGACANINMR